MTKRFGAALAGWIGVGLLSAILFAGCGSSDDTARPPEIATDRATTSQPVSITPAPVGTDSDPLARLPEASSTAWLLVSTLDETWPLRLFDLADGTAVDIADVTGDGHQQGGFTSSGDPVFVVGPRSLGVLEASSGKRRLIDLPEGVDGSVETLDVFGNLIAVSTLPSPSSDSRTVLLELDGSLRCSSEVGFRFSRFESGSLWPDDLRSRLDPTTCDVTEGLRVPGDAYQWFFVVAGDSAYVAVGDRILGRFDLASGQPMAKSPLLEGFISDAVVQGDNAWILTGGSLVKADAETLQPITTSEFLDSDCEPRFVQQATDIYVLDDCMGALFHVDPVAGVPDKGWSLPNDGSSDSATISVATDEGIWIVDGEQTGVPYLFATHEQRFERLPISRSQSADIYALDFDVHPGPRD